MKLIYGILGVVALAFIVSIYLDGRTSVSDDAIDHQYAAEVHNTQAWKARYDLARIDSAALEAEITRLSQRETLAKVEADSFAKERDSLRATLPPLVGVAAESWMRVVTLDSLEIDRLQLALAKATERGDRLKVDRDLWKELTDGADRMSTSMAATLEAEDKARQCHVLWIPCPSRKTVALAAFGVGIAAGVELSRR